MLEAEDLKEVKHIFLEEFSKGKDSPKQEFEGLGEHEELTQLQSSVALGVSHILSSSISSGVIGSSLGFGISNQQEMIEKFSKEVAEYATSKEIISSLVKETGEPKRDETEDDFVERASQVLRSLLKRKFKV